MGTFALGLRELTEKAKDRNNQLVRKVLFELGTELVMKSPVGDAVYWKAKPPKGYVGGRFRANWQYSEGALDASTNENIDPEGSATIEEETAKIDDVAIGKMHYWTNSLPYAERIEDGWSRQAPVGVVGITIKEFEPLVYTIARELS